MVPIIEIPGYGSTSAKLMCEKLKIKSCKEADKLKKAKEEVRINMAPIALAVAAATAVPFFFHLFPVEPSMENTNDSRGVGFPPAYSGTFFFSLWGCTHRGVVEP